MDYLPSYTYFFTNNMALLYAGGSVRLLNDILIVIFGWSAGITMLISTDVDLKLKAEKLEYWLKRFKEVNGSEKQ